MNIDQEFWEYLNVLYTNSCFVVDRPKGSIHRKNKDLIYPLDYGYLEGTTTIDGGGIDVWVGSEHHMIVKEFICTVDLYKKDVEIKLLIGCTLGEIQKILDFHNQHSMRAYLITRY